MDGSSTAITLLLPAPQVPAGVTITLAMDLESFGRLRPPFTFCWRLCLPGSHYGVPPPHPPSPLPPYPCQMQAWSRPIPYSFLWTM